MRRAELVDLLAEERLVSDDPLTDDDWEDWYSMVPVKVLRGNLATDPPWDAFGQVRKEVGGAANRGYQDMKSALQSSECIAEQLVNTYRISDDGWWQKPALACGGCPACRRERRVNRASTSPPFRHRAWVPPTSDRLQTLAAGIRPLVVRLEGGSNPGQVDIHMIERLVAHGVKHFFLPRGWTDLVRASRQVGKRTIFIDNTHRLEEFPPPFFWAASCVVWEADMAPHTLIGLLDGSTRPDVLIVPDAQPDPRQSSRVLCEMVPCIPASQVRNI